MLENLSVPEAAPDQYTRLVYVAVVGRDPKCAARLLQLQRRVVRNKRILLICRASQPGSWPYACGRCTVSVRALAGLGAPCGPLKKNFSKTCGDSFEMRTLFATRHARCV